MITISALQDSDKGRKVIYARHNIGVNPPLPAPESGRILSWNEHYIFVCYGSSQHALATDPHDLEWDLSA